MNALVIVPPYTIMGPPAAPAALLGYLEAHGAGAGDLAFHDLRLWAPPVYAPTYRAQGTYAESFVIDVPDLPLVLTLIRARDEGKTRAFEDDALFTRYCLERSINPERLLGYLSSMERFLEAALAPLGAARFVGFSVWTSNYLTTLMAAALLKRRRDPPFVLAGGPQLTESRAAAKIGLATGLFDAVALGEGEATLLEVLAELGRGNAVPAGKIPGTLMRDSSGSWAEVPRGLLSLPALPPPSFAAMDLPSYRLEGRRALPYQLSRGCTDECTFCSEWVFWKRFRSDTPDHAVEQLAGLQERYGLDTILFTDSLLNGHMKRLRGFAESLLSRGLKLSWGGFMRADMDPETAALLSRAGLDRAFIGVESMSDETLERMNKRRTEADNIRAMRALLEAGVRVKVGLIPGFPGDTRARFEHTVQAVMELSRRHPGRLQVNLEPFVVSPGQPLAADLASAGLTARPWAEEYLELAPELRQITGAIACTVEGANQGAERMGQIAWLQSLIEDRDAGVWFSHSNKEAVSSAPSLTWIEGGAVLVTRKSSAGLVYGVIVSAEEQQSTGIMVELSADSPSYPGLDAIAARHFLPPGQESPRIVRFEGRRAIDPGTRLIVSPFTVGRTVSAATVIIAHVLSKSAVEMPIAVQPILAELGSNAMTHPETAAFIASRRIPVDPAQWQAAAADLYRAGYLTALPAASAAASHA